MFYPTGYLIIFIFLFYCHTQTIVPILFKINVAWQKIWQNKLNFSFFFSIPNWNIWCILNVHGEKNHTPLHPFRTYKPTILKHYKGSSPNSAHINRKKFFLVTLWPPTQSVKRNSILRKSAFYKTLFYHLGQKIGFLKK